MDGDASSRAVDAATAVVGTAAESVVRLGGPPDAVAAILFTMGQVPMLEAYRLTGLSQEMEDLLLRVCADLDAAAHRVSAILDNLKEAPPPPSNVVSINRARSMAGPPPRGAA